MKAVGERVHTAVLTEGDVRQIRAMYREGVRGYGYKALADKFGVSKHNLVAIIKRWTWRQV